MRPPGLASHRREVVPHATKQPIAVFDRCVGCRCGAAACSSSGADRQTLRHQHLQRVDLTMPNELDPDVQRLLAELASLAGEERRAFPDLTPRDAREWFVMLRRIMSGPSTAPPAS